MKLFDQDAKAEMERCKKIARSVGLKFDEDTIEYVVSNKDMIWLSPKIMIPTLFDYWVHDIGVIQGEEQYKMLPHNPYETAINTRPPISFYNQDNADWLNVMIFYHVLGHFDYFQNNVFFRNTWDDDFAGQALADKRLINRIRSELGSEKRWVDYVIEFAKGIDNLVGFFEELQVADRRDNPQLFGADSNKADFYFGKFLRDLHDKGKLKLKVYHEELARYNRCIDEFGIEEGERAFFADPEMISRFPEFRAKFRKWEEEEGDNPAFMDIFEYLWENSAFLNEKENAWMKDVMQVIRRTSLYFQPQIRTKISNEGWASLWHQRLFVQDDRISTHEAAYARVDSGVTTSPGVGVNPYATGKLLFEFIEHLASKGRLSREYQMLEDIEKRRGYDRGDGLITGKEALFWARKYLNDELLINFLSEKDFQDFVDQNRLYVLGVRPHREEFGKAEIYIKSKNGEYYREQLRKQLYHPPNIVINEDKAEEDQLYLDHVYEGRELNRKGIENVLIGLQFLWDGPVALETTVYEEVQPKDLWAMHQPGYQPEHIMYRVIYTCDSSRRVEMDILE
ncbi:MAG: SpoVR family protein [Candidatus Spechtbacterales bacterium]|nr:SpoVR family protein [Candidatus Spechtbacterales bacterium]